MALFASDKKSKKVQQAERVAASAAQAQVNERATGSKKRAESYWAVSWNIFKKNKLGMFCLFVVVDDQSGKRTPSPSKAERLGFRFP